MSDGVFVHTWNNEVVPMETTRVERDVLLLDGDCGLCHRLAQFIDKRRTSDADLAYRPILSEDAQKLIATFPEKQQVADTVYIIRNGKSYIRSAAGIRALLYMKWYWRMWFPLVATSSFTSPRHCLRHHREKSTSCILKT